MAPEKLLDIVAAECPKCGAGAQLDPGQERGFCQYCGTQLIFAQKKEIHQHFGETVGTVQAHLTMAETAMKGENYEAAISYLDHVIRVQPDGGDAWILKAEACRKFCVMKTQIRTRPTYNLKMQQTGTETYSEEVPTFPRLKEGEAAFIRGVELLERDLNSPDADADLILRKIYQAYVSSGGIPAANRYMLSLTERNPTILFPYERLVEAALQGGETIAVARFTRQALENADGAGESPVINRGRDHTLAELARLDQVVEAARGRNANRRIHTYASAGLALLGILLFSQGIGLFVLIGAAVYYATIVHKRQKGQDEAEAASETLHATWGR